MHLFIENNIRGGISMISNRYAKANNKYTEDGLDSTLPTNFFEPDWCEQPLRLRNESAPSHRKFQIFDRRRNQTHINILNVPDDHPTGYILEVDLEYPHDLHELHNDYPLAPEKVLITKEMLSLYAQSFTDRHVLSEKLVPNLTTKRNTWPIMSTWNFTFGWECDWHAFIAFWNLPKILGSKPISTSTQTRDDRRRRTLNGTFINWWTIPCLARRWKIYETVWTSIS